MRAPLALAVALTAAPALAAGSAGHPGGGSAPAAATPSPAEVAADRWHELLKAKQDEAARAECAAMSASQDADVAAEGFKCLANVELRGADHLQLDAAPSGGVMRDGLHGEGVDRALGFLRKALALAPQDLSVHQGRFDVLVAASRFGEVPAALQDSIATYPGDALDQWLGVSSDLFHLGRMDECLAVSRVLAAKWPNEHRVVGNLGSVLSVLEKDDEALGYLKRAVELAPDDPIDRWNLSRLLDFMGRDDEAAASYARWSEIETDPGRIERNSCVYASFVENKRRDLERACRLQERFCPQGARTACARLSAPATPLPEAGAVAGDVPKEAPR